MFDFRNANGDSPITVADMVQLHNYAIAYLAHNNIPPTPGAKPFWDHPSVIAAIKPKYVEYLQAIAHRLKILKETLVLLMHYSSIYQQNFLCQDYKEI